MDIAEALKLANELVFAKTGENLDYLQEAILRGTLQCEKYSEIAAETHASEGHVRDVGSELWKILSDGLGENVSKANVRSILEKAKFYNFSPTIGSDNVTVNNHLNICQEKARFSQVKQQPQRTPAQLHVNLGDAPEVFTFYGRTDKLSTWKAG